MRNDIRPEMNKKYNTISMYVLGVAAIIIIFVMFFVFMSPISTFAARILRLMSPFFYGFALAYIICPVCNFFDRFYNKLFAKVKHTGALKRHAGLATSYILFLLFLTLFFYIIIPQMVQSINSFVANYMSYITGLEDFFSDLSDRFEFISPQVIAAVKQNIMDIFNRSVKLLSDISPKIINMISGVAVSLWNMILGFIISIYILAERKTFARQAKMIVFALLPKNAAQTVIRCARKTHIVFGGFVNGKLLDSLIIGILCFIGLSILRIPYTPLVSVIVGVTDFIPYFGPFLGAIPSFIIIFLNDPIKAIWFAIFILVLQQIDGNLIGPRILHETIGVSSFWIIFSLLVMGGLYGVAGMILAVPVFALFHMAVGKLTKSALERKGHPEIQEINNKKEDV